MIVYVIVVSSALAIAFVVLLASDNGPTSEEAASAYLAAWNRRDLRGLWDLSGTELHEHRTRHEFIAAHRDKPPHEFTSTLDVDDLVMERRDGRWVVISNVLGTAPV